MMIGGVQKQTNKQSGKRKRGPSKEDVSAAPVKTKQLRMENGTNGNSVDGSNQKAPTRTKTRSGNSHNETPVAIQPRINLRIQPENTTGKGIKVVPTPDTIFTPEGITKKGVVGEVVRAANEKSDGVILVHVESEVCEVQFSKKDISVGDTVSFTLHLNFNGTVTASDIVCHDDGLAGYSVSGFLFKGSASPWYPHRFSILMRIIGKMGAFSMRSLKTDAVIREISYEVNPNNMTVMLKKLSESYWESLVAATKKPRTAHCVLTHFAQKPMMIGGVQKQTNKQSGKRKRGPSKEDASAAPVKTKQLRMENWTKGNSVDGSNQKAPARTKTRSGNSHNETPVAIQPRINLRIQPENTTGKGIKVVPTPDTIFTPEGITKKGVVGEVVRAANEKSDGVILVHVESEVCEVQFSKKDISVGDTVSFTLHLNFNGTVTASDIVCHDDGLAGYSVSGFLFKGSASPWYPHRFSILMRIIGKMGAFSMRSLKTDAVIREISYEVNPNNMTVMLKKLSESYWESLVAATKKPRTALLLMML
eukprot:sb/3463745/